MFETIRFILWLWKQPKRIDELTDQVKLHIKGVSYPDVDKEAIKNDFERDMEELRKIFQERYKTTNLR